MNKSLELVILLLAGILAYYVFKVSLIPIGFISLIAMYFIFN